MGGVRWGSTQIFSVVIDEKNLAANRTTGPV